MFEKSEYPFNDSDDNYESPEEDEDIIKPKSQEKKRN